MYFCIGNASSRGAAGTGTPLVARATSKIWLEARHQRGAVPAAPGGARHEQIGSWRATRGAPAPPRSTGTTCQNAGTCYQSWMGAGAATPLAVRATSRHWLVARATEGVPAPAPPSCARHAATEGRGMRSGSGAGVGTPLVTGASINSTGRGVCHHGAGAGTCPFLHHTAPLTSAACPIISFIVGSWGCR